MNENKFNNKNTMYLADAIHVLKKDRCRMLKMAEDFPEFRRRLSVHIQAQDAVLDFVNEVIKEHIQAQNSVLDIVNEVIKEIYKEKEMEK